MDYEPLPATRVKGKAEPLVAFVATAVRADTPEREEDDPPPFVGRVTRTGAAARPARAHDRRPHAAARDGRRRAGHRQDPARARPARSSSGRPTTASAGIAAAAVPSGSPSPTPPSTRSCDRSRASCRTRPATEIRARSTPSSAGLEPEHGRTESGWPPGCVRSSGCRSTTTRPPTSTRPSRRGRASSNRPRNAGLSRSSSRICTGRTTPCSGSSNGSWNARPTFRCSCSARPGRSCSPVVPAWAAGVAARHDDLALAAHRRRDVGAARPLLLRSVMSPESSEVLLRRAGGNPLYAREFVHMLEDRGETRAGDRRRIRTRRARAAAASVNVPDTVQALIAARLDALEAADRRLLQAASVIGDRFWRGALARWSRTPPDLEASLRTLQRRGIDPSFVDQRDRWRSRVLVRARLDPRRGVRPPAEARPLPAASRRSPTWLEPIDRTPA